MRICTPEVVESRTRKIVKSSWIRNERSLAVHLLTAMTPFEMRPDLSDNTSACGQVDLKSNPTIKSGIEETRAMMGP